MSISMKEVKKHKKPRSAWIVIHNNVYDISRFLDEHPGGKGPLLENAGKDATRAFEDVGHSQDAREMMRKYKIGSLPSSEATTDPGGSAHSQSSKKGESSRTRLEKNVSTIIVPLEKGSPDRSWMWLLLALAVAAGGAFGAYKYLNKG